MNGPRPEFSAEMLRGFLFARAMARDGFDVKAKRAALVDELIDLTGLPHSTIRDAFSGRLRDGAARAQIWAVLGHFPCDHGIVLTDDGKQTSSASRAEGAEPALGLAEGKTRGAGRATTRGGQSPACPEGRIDG
ncbi:MAG: hypothetical protein ACK4GT_00225 [Pararhodobacter sp.]